MLQGWLANSAAHVRWVNKNRAAQLWKFCKATYVPHSACKLFTHDYTVFEFTLVFNIPFRNALPFSFSNHLQNCFDFFARRD